MGGVAVNGTRNGVVERSYRNFLITGTQRTGSSALAEAVGTHPRIACGWEWSEHCRWDLRLRVAESGLRGRFDLLGAKDRAHMEGLVTPEVDWIGFRRLFGASNKWLGHPRMSAKLWWDRFETHLDWIRNRADLRVIHVVRNDNLEWLKSKYVAHTTRQFVGTAYPEINVTVPIRAAKARIRAKVWVDGRISELAGSNPYLRIDYEDLAADLPGVAERAAAFLDCDPAGLSLDRTVIRRQSSGAGREYIANYDALAASLNRCGLAGEPMES